tara:strand:+ start:9150 stop:9326 length:177 start_codon:yes stop_codon:yes gene_type:complete
MKYKPVYEYTDKRASERYHHEEDRRKTARKNADKLLGKNYFTNTQSHDETIELNERKK